MTKFLILLLIIIASNVLSEPLPMSFAYDSSKVNLKKDDAIPEGITAQEVIKNFVNAIGGEEKIFNIVDRTTIMRGTVQGINVTMLIYQKAPNKLKQQIKAGANEQIIIFDGEKGSVNLAGEKQEITGSELEKLKYESTIALLTDPEYYGLMLTFGGVEIIDSLKTYKIVMTLPSGINWTQYYSADTFLKVKESKYVNSPMGLFEQNIFYYDYQEVDGIKFPFKIKQSIGAQSMEFTVSSVKINSGIADREFDIE